MKRLLVLLAASAAVPVPAQYSTNIPPCLVLKGLFNLHQIF
jgi:hypothetical protein